MLRRPYWIVVLAGLISACASVRTTALPAATAPALAAAQPLRSESYLHVDGRRLVAADGHEVQLRGVNLGGWLVTEDWMCGIDDPADDKGASGAAGVAGRHALETLQGRFGLEKAKQLIDAWRDNWITAGDLDRVQAAGFNLVRVPISYRSLQNEDGGWILNAKGEVDFSRMDWIVREAARRGLYTIFDLHVWPEQRLASEKIGRPEGEAIRQSMSRLWTTIADHYRGEGAIAGFDLINEFPGAWGVQQVLSEALRRADPDRVQIVEGFTLSEFLKLRQAGAFPNAVFSEHLYGDAPLSTDEMSRRLKDDLDSPVPVYVGEFLAKDFQSSTGIMNTAKISWSSWTYKTVDMGDWGVFNYGSSLRTDILHDSFEAILSRWASELVQWRKPGSSPNFSVNDERRPIGS